MYHAGMAWGRLAVAVVDQKQRKEGYLSLARSCRLAHVNGQLGLTKSLDCKINPDWRIS